MRSRTGLLFLLAALLGAAVVVLPVVAVSATTATVNAESNSTSCGTYYPNCFSPAQVTVTAGDSVSFQNSSGNAHGVVWRAENPATPMCSGVPVGSSSTNFNGTCTFSQAGTYNFYCYVHGPSMSGTVTVSPSGTTTTTTATTQPSPPGAAGTTTTMSGQGGAGATSGVSGSAGSPLAGSASEALKLAASQHGRSVRGSLKLSQAGAGARLEVDLLARGASLAKAPHSAQVRIGRVVRSSLTAGKVSFTVSINAKAGHALASHRRLALTVMVLLTPKHGSAVTITRSVVLHA